MDKIRERPLRTLKPVSSRERTLPRAIQAPPVAPRRPMLMRFEFLLFALLALSAYVALAALILSRV